MLRDRSRRVPLVAALVLAACSGDDGGAPAERAAPTVEAGPTAATTSTTAAALATTEAGPDPAPQAAPSSAPTSLTSPAPTFSVEAFPVPAGSAPHDVSPAADGGVWFTAQASGQLGWLDPATGQTRLIELGPGSRPHGVITAADGAAWVTDGGRNSLIRVDGDSGELTEHPLPEQASGANLNTAVIAADGVLWFTGQEGWYGRLRPGGVPEVFPAPKGPGPYGITATAAGEVYYASLAGNYLGRIDPATGAATVLEPPVPGQGSRRAWADGGGRIWVSGWSSGDLFRYEPASGAWASWRLPGGQPQPYAVFVDDIGSVWLSDFGANSLVRFDPLTEAFTPFPLPSPDARVRQLHGRPGEVWGAESAADQLVVVRRSG
jgi:virginiamycin B lyase